MKTKARIEGFQAVVRDHLHSTSYFEEGDGDFRRWPELSDHGKLQYIINAAAMYNVPFEPFAATVQDVFRDVPPAAIVEASLRMVLGNGKELHALEQLVPDDRGTEAPDPLIDRFKEILNSNREQTVEQRGQDQARGRDF